MPTPEQLKAYLDVVLGGLCGGLPQALIFLLLVGIGGYLLARYWFAPRHESIVATIGDHESALSATKGLLQEVRAQHEEDRARLKKLERALEEKEARLQELGGSLSEAATNERELVFADIRLLRAKYIGSRMASHAIATAFVHVADRVILKASIINLLNGEQLVRWSDLSDAAKMQGEMEERLGKEHEVLSLAADWQKPGPPLKVLLDSHDHDLWKMIAQFQKDYFTKVRPIATRKGHDFPSNLDAIEGDDSRVALQNGE